MTFNVSALQTIPRIVCETLHALDLHEESPSWKIMDNKGRITVVLHWDQRSHKVEKLLNALQTDSSSKSKKPQSILKDKSTSFEIPESILKREQDIRIQEPHHHHPPPYMSFDTMRPPAAFFKEPQFSRFLKAGSFENANLHRHTIECGSGSHNVVDIRPGSPHGNGECDFHCCVLHEEGRKIAVTRTVATSPIHQSAASSIADNTKKSGKNVRFLDVEEHVAIHSEEENDNQSNSSETDTDTTTTLTEEEGVTEKFLLLVDEQKRHLSIKDIGVILERLSSKIIDVERLDRENENNDCRNWTIKATIRGDGLEELGLIYAGRYYEISEHPGYKEATSNFREEKGIIQNVEARV